MPCSPGVKENQNFDGSVSAMQTLAKKPLVWAGRLPRSDGDGRVESEVRRTGKTASLCSPLANSLCGSPTRGQP